MRVNYLPSIVYPKPVNGGWQMAKVTYGPTTYGPGRGADGSEDFAD